MNEIETRVEELEKEVKKLRNELEENEKKDKDRYDKLVDLEVRQAEDEKRWDKMGNAGGLLTPLVLLIPILKDVFTKDKDKNKGGETPMPFMTS